MSVLTLNQIFKSYGKVQALKGVSFEVPRGSVFGILGPNGSGKTTLLSIILDVLNADGGAYSWFGQPGSKLQRRGIGSLLETPNFYHYLSAVNNLKITQSISGRGNEEQIMGVLKKVNLFERRNSRFSTYSLGMKQRLAIAGTLLGNPEVLVFDEPTNGLDPVGIAEIRDLIRELHEHGHTIIMASHLLDEVEKVCSHVAILKAGELITTGTVDEVLADETIVEVSAENMTALNEILSAFPDVKNQQWQEHQITLHFNKGEDPAENLNKFCFERGIVLKQLHTRKKKLEARFFELTNN
ncbi:ABC transporter ATP-binding protein [Flavihumibacter rivuli]|uniref:ABC transporter ATP-binding protein n=1 Tax=Flavihumibacter rivuli TaxID=2838156 RepID=UPI001BDF061C|nr:ABC transporter ATP-binding protein [Flavihumibacter rivuli]ULQ56547.1 ABC transporter ATP-binding protein [Flavihumibacter rivuli]